MANKKKYLVSIILPVYNVERFLEKCLNSIINQTYKNIEIITVNDGSTDNSLQVIEKTLLKEPRLKLINIENQGVSIARNTGIKAATGDFLVFVDSDDYIENDFIEYMLSIYEVTKADICISMNNFTTKDKIQIKTDKITTLTPECGVAELLYPRVRMGVWNKLWKKEFIDKNQFLFLPGQHTAEGLIFMTNAAQYANRIGVGQRKVYCYRLDNDMSATTKANVEKYGIGSLMAMDKVEKNLDMNSTIIRNAMNYQRWSTSTFALRQILDANAKKDYYELYKDLIKYIRHNSLKMLKKDVNVPLRTKLIAIARWINPVLITKLSLYMRDRHIKASKKENWRSHE